MSEDRQRSEAQAAVREAWSALVRPRFDACALSGAMGESRTGRMALADLELEALQEQLVLAKQQRNRINGICALPSEVLTTIFRIAQDVWAPQGTAEYLEEDKDDTPPDTHRTVYSLGWMAISHTCSLWRQIALGAPVLWCTIHCLDVHPRSIPTLLARSRYLPLTLIVDGKSATLDGDSTWPCPASLFLPSLSRRTKSLVICNLPDVAFKSWRDALRQPMDRLEHFAVEGIRPQPEPTSSVSLYRNIFKRTVPKLKSLKLIGVGFSWTSALFSPNLVSLTLHFPEVQDAQAIVHSPPSTQHFATILSSMACLQELSLCDVFPVVPQDEHTLGKGISSITLPACFRNLYLRAGPRFVTRGLYLFNNMVIPERAQVTLSVHLNDAVVAGSDTVALTHAVSHLFHEQGHLAAPRELWLGSLSIVMQNVDRPAGGLLRRTLPCSVNPWTDLEMADGGRCLCTDYGDRPEDTGSDNEEEEYSFVESRISSLPIQKLRSIFCAKDPAGFTFPSQYWIDTFTSARDVQNVSLQYNEAQYLSEALCERDVSVGHFSLFPSLSTLALHSGGYFEDPPSKAVLRNRYAREVAIVEMLHVRREHGAPLKEVLVAKVMAEWDVWDRMKELVHVEFF